MHAGKRWRKWRQANLIKVAHTFIKNTFTTVTPLAPLTSVEASFSGSRAFRQLHRILGENLVLEASKASGFGVLGVNSFLKAPLKNLP